MIEISASSLDQFGYGPLVRGLRQASRTIETFLEDSSPMVFKAADGTKYEADLKDALIILAMDHYVVGDCLKKNKGDFEATRKEVIEIFSKIMDIPLISYAMLDAGALPRDKNIALSKEIVEMGKAKGVVIEAEVSATGGLGEEASGNKRVELKTIADIRRYLDEEIYPYRDAVRPVALAFEAGSKHRATKGKYAELSTELLETFAKESARDSKAIPYIIHGGSSVSDEQLRALRGLYGKVNKATEPKREALRAVAEHVIKNIPGIMDNINGLINEKETGICSGLNENKIDELHHPRTISFGLVPYVMKLAMQFNEVVGSVGRSPYLLQEIQYAK